MVADGWFEIGGQQEGHLRLNLELDVVEFGIGCRGELLRHLELVSEIEFGLSWIPMDGLRLVDDKGI